MILKFQYYLILCLVFGALSAVADGLLHSPNPIPYMTGGAGFLGGFAYIGLLVLGKFVE